MFEITFYAASLWLVALITLLLASSIFAGSSDRSARAFSIFTITVVMWVASCGCFFASATEEVATFFMRTNYFTGTLTAISFWYFTLTFPENKKQTRGVKAVMLFLGILMALLHYFEYLYTYLGLVTTNLSIKTVSVIDRAVAVAEQYKWGWTFADGDFLFYMVFASFWLAGICVIYVKSKNLQEEKLRKHATYMFYSMVIGVIPPTIMNVILPGYHVFAPFWFGVLSISVWISAVAYTIIKFQQLNVRLVYAELLVFVGLLLLFINLFV